MLTPQSHNFWISGPASVAFTQFNVTSSGKVRIRAKWVGQSSQLTLELQGRRRPSMPDPTAPYAEVTGTSPLELAYTVTPQELARGVSWRAVLRDASGNHDARGELTIETPVNEDREQAFRVQGMKLRSGDVWPTDNLSYEFFSRLNGGSTTALHGVVTLSRACTCQDNLRLERDGVKLLRYLPGRHAIARIDRRFTPGSNPLITSVSLLEPEDKIDPNILVGNYARFNVAPSVGSVRNQVSVGPGLVSVTVTFFPGTPLPRINQILTAEGVPFQKLSDVHWQITLPESRLRPLAANDEVEAIDPAPAPPMSDNDNSGVLINANLLQNATFTPAGAITYAGVTGQGVTVGVQDTGVDATHGDLNVVASIAEIGDGSHGTHVAGTIAGSGTLSNGTNTAGTANGGTAFQWRGIAPNAGLIASGDLDTASNMRTGIQTNSLDLYNRSQSYGYDGNYDAENNRIDSLIRGGATDSGTIVPPRLLVTSAGNHGASPGNQAPAGGGTLGTTTNVAGGTGYFSITKQVKNGILVGNQSSLAAAATVALAPGSSLGPAFDGRLKPDVLALGTAVISTGTVGDGSCVNTGNLSNGYVACNGTSMASPAIAGGVAQLLELWQNTYNAPIGATLDANPPLPALMRALVTGTTADVVQVDVRGAVSPDLDLDNNNTNGNDGQGRVPATLGPDYATGWGTANINAAATILTDTRAIRGRTLSNRMIQGTISQGGTREYDFVVSQAGQVRVTLAWDDTEATTLNPATSPMLVNDLDLELTGADGTIYYPWRLGHTITDPSGNALGDAAQTAGTDIRVALPITPVTGPLFTWTFNCNPGTVPPGCPTSATATAPVNPDYVPIDAVDGNGTNDVWVAATGKDHLNNVEQVLVNVPNNATQFGHWKARVTGFNIRENAQSFALVGFPYPALAELVPSSTDRVAFATFGTPISFNWKVQNVSGTGTGVGFTHQVMLSRDFALDNDVALPDSNSAAFAALAGGAEVNRSSTITINQADAAALLGNPAATVEDLIASDAFILVRADSGDNVLEHDDVNLLAIQLGRQVDVVTVYDRSGSMSASVPITGGSQTKLQQLQDSANLFIDMLRRDAGDRLGQVSFASSESTDFSDGSGAVKSFGAADVGTVQAAISGLSASGSTNIRSALEKALTLIPASTDRRKVVIFLSDGMRTAGGDPAEASFLQKFTDNDIKVFSVGFGTEGGDGLSGIDIGLLQSLANVGPGGFFHVTQSGLELDKFFVNALANAVVAEVIVDPVETLLPGQTKDVPINVAGPDRVVTFALTWDNPVQRPAFELVSPSGIVINSSNVATFGDAVKRLDTATYALVQINLPVGVGPNQLHAGAWRMRVRNGGGGAVRFAASAITETNIVEATTIEPSADGIHDVGEPFAITTVVRNAGQPVSDATVMVRARIPTASLGNVLSSAGITTAEFNATPTTLKGETLSIVQRLTMALTRRLGHDPISYAIMDAVALPVQGQPGVYRAMFERTRATGPYTFTARTEGLTKECEVFNRESVTSAYIAPKTDGRHTPVGVKSSRTGTFAVSFVPRDVTGGFVGPGLGPRITVQAKGATAASELTDRLDGSYEQTFTGVAGEPAAAVVVTIDGTVLPARTVSLTAPVIKSLTVSSGTGGEPTRTQLRLEAVPSARLETIRGILLTRDGTEAPIREFDVDATAQAIDIVIPAGLEPGVYHLAIVDANGTGAVSPAARFAVR